MKERLPAVAALAPVLLLIAIYLAPVWSGLNTRIVAPYGGVDAVMQAGILEWTGQHFWQPSVWYNLPIFYPESGALAFMDSLLAQSVLVLPLRWLLAGNPALLYNMAFAACLVLAAWAFSVLWRSSGGRWSGAACGALALVGSPYTLSQIGHLNQLPPPAVLLALAALLLAVKGCLAGAGSLRYWWLWAGAMLLQAAWGWYGLAFALLASGFVLVWASWRCWRTSRLSWMVRAAGGPLLVVALGVWLLATPYHQASIQHEDYQRSQEEVRAFSADLGHFLNRGAYRQGWADLTGDGKTGAERYAHHPRQVLHPGWLALGLALVGWLSRKRLDGYRRQTGLIMLGIGAMGLVVAFGDSVQLTGSERRLPLPWGLSQDLLPPLRAFRAVWRFSFLFTLAISWWAAAGCEALCHGPQLRRRSRWVPVLVCGGLLLAAWPAKLPAVAVPDPTAYETWPLAGQPAGAVLTLPAPATEADEDLTEALWLHRALRHGRSVTGGVSGWVPASARRLRTRLTNCREGQYNLEILLEELHVIGVRYIEIADGDLERAAFWQKSLQGLGYRQLPSDPGYSLYVIESSER